ncbi:late competence protein ComER [Bacillus carboniphilus]|uniref:Late competence protein ComER n=1 Tax=Bacillus carboniphilus TaxID=86663 RepID=A0ABY9JYZ3_9BACI|nr:late competence protein ComER [Bacillus carboniphilus]WLR44009.1 late competence protein ComER [Bacillus carboniphilus]
MKIGFIGTGNMGRILIEALYYSETVSGSNMYIHNRTIQKAIQIQEQIKDLHVKISPEDVLNSSDFIFLCLKPLDIYPFIEKYKQYFRDNKCLISITSPIEVEQIESITTCQVARIIPSITNRTFSGVSLFTFGHTCTNETKEKLKSLFSHISTPVEINSNITRVASDIVSCGPAFFSYIMEQFIEAAVQETSITKVQASLLAEEMMKGYGKILTSDLYNLTTLKEKVCVQGGVTGEGIKVLEKKIGTMFNELFKSTHEKYREDKLEINKQFNT